MALLDPSSDNKLVFKEKVSGAYINLTTTYSNVVAYLYDSTTVVNKWSRTAQTGYDLMYATDVYTLEFYVERGTVDDYKGKALRLELKVVKAVTGRGLTSNVEHTLGKFSLNVDTTEMGTAA